MLPDRVSSTLLFLFSVFVVFKARALPYWAASAPGPGFLPFWLGVMLACASAGLFVKTFTAAEPETPMPDRATAVRIGVVVLLTASAAALSLLVGVVLAGGAFMAATLAYLRPGHARANGVAALLTPIVIWLLFVRWLGVPLPTGPFGF